MGGEAGWSLHHKAEKHTRGPRTIERSEIVWGGFGRGRAGGFPATPSSTLGRPRTASSFKELFSLCSKAFEPLAVPGAPACFPGSECGVPPCPNSPGLPGRPANPSPLPRVYPMNSRCARNHGGPPRVYKERSGPPIFPRRGNVGVSSAHPPGVGGKNSALPPYGHKSTTNALPP